MQSGGAKRMMSSWVGLASRPFSFICRQMSHAVFLPMGFVTMALSRPRPRTSTMNGDLIFLISARKSLPIFSAFCTSFSSFTTFSASTATRAAKGKPPKVEPCSPGLMLSITSSSAKQAETGSTPPPSAFPNTTMSGRMPSCIEQSIFPVRAIPVCTSSAMNSTLCFLQRS